MIKKAQSLTIITLAFFFVFSIFLTDKTVAEESSTLNNVFDRVGIFIKNNPELLSAAVESIQNYNNIEDKVATINNIEISLGELKFRQGLKEMAGDIDSDYESVFNILVEEKAIFAYALNENLLPSEDELITFISWEMQVYNNDEDYKKIIDLFCDKSGMSLQAYWNEYEKYNAFRVLMLKKVYDYSVSQAQAEGKLANENVIELQKEKEDYWYSFKKEIKNKINVEINEEFEYLNLVVDKNNIYR